MMATMAVKVAVLIPAAGASRRFKGKRKKQFADLNGRAVFLRTIEMFADRDALAPFAADRQYCITFTIPAWPHLAEGDYSLTLAAADGPAEEHQQCHFVHEALIIRSVPLRHCNVGIFSLPDTEMSCVEIK